MSAGRRSGTEVIGVIERYLEQVIREHGSWLAVLSWGDDRRLMRDGGHGRHATWPPRGRAGSRAGRLAECAQQPRELGRIVRLGRGLKFAERPPAVAVNHGGLLVISPIRANVRRADPEQEEVLLLPVPCPVEAELGHLMPDGVAEILRLGGEAGLLAQLADRGLGEALVVLRAAADREPVRCVRLGRIVAVQEQHPALSVNDKHAACPPAHGLARSHDFTLPSLPRARRSCACWTIA